MSSFANTLEEILRKALDEELVPLLVGLAEGNREELQQAVSEDVREVATRVGKALARGDEVSLRMLRGAGRLIADRHRIELEERHAEALEAAMGIALNVAPAILSQPWFQANAVPMIVPTLLR